MPPKPDTSVVLEAEMLQELCAVLPQGGEATLAWLKERDLYVPRAYQGSWKPEREGRSNGHWRLNPGSYRSGMDHLWDAKSLRLWAGVHAQLCWCARHHRAIGAQQWASWWAWLIIEAHKALGTPITGEILAQEFLDKYQADCH